MKTRPLGHASATFEKEGKVHILSVFLGGGGRKSRERKRESGGEELEREKEQRATWVERGQWAERG